MKLYQETRLQAIMIVATAVGAIAALGFLIAGLVYMEMLYLFFAALLLGIIFPIIVIGSRRAETVMARVKKIREGGGDEADLEWLKTRTK